MNCYYLSEEGGQAGKGQSRNKRQESEGIRCMFKWTLPPLSAREEVAFKWKRELPGLIRSRFCTAAASVFFGQQRPKELQLRLGKMLLIWFERIMKNTAIIIFFFTNNKML